MTLEKADRAAILAAAQAAGLDASRLRDENPWAVSDSPTALSLRTAVCTLHPEVAQRLQEEAGVKLSLAASAALDGSAPMTAAVESELQRVMPAKHAEIVAQRENEAWNASPYAAHAAQLEEQIKAHGGDPLRLEAAGLWSAAGLARRRQEDAARAEEQRLRAEAVAMLQRMRG